MADVFSGNLRGTRKPFQAGTGPLEASAQFQADSTTAGLLPPRMTTAQRVAIATPAEGLMVFDTDFDTYYVFQAASWKQLSGVHVGDLVYYVDGTSGDDANGGTSWADAKKTFTFTRETSKEIPRTIIGNLTLNVRGVVCSVDNVHNLNLKSFLVSGGIYVTGEMTAVATGLAVTGFENTTSVITHHSFITTTGAGWTVGAHKGRYVLITAGTGVGTEYYPILDNTADTLELIALPDLSGTSVYSIVAPSEIRGALTGDPSTLIEYLDEFLEEQDNNAAHLRFSNLRITADDALTPRNYIRIGSRSSVSQTEWYYCSIDSTFQQITSGGNDFYRCWISLDNYRQLASSGGTLGSGATFFGYSVVYASGKTGGGVKYYASPLAMSGCRLKGQDLAIGYYGSTYVELYELFIDNCNIGLNVSGSSVYIDNQNRFVDTLTAISVLGGQLVVSDSATFLTDTVTTELSLGGGNTYTFAEIGTKNISNAAMGSSVVVYNWSTDLVDHIDEYDGTTAGLVATSYQNAIDEVDSNTDRAYVDERRYGLVDPDNTTTLSFNPATYEITLTPVGATWAYWRNGVRHTVTGAKTATMAGTPPVAGTYFVYADSTDGTLTADTSEWTLADTKVPVAIVAWNDALTPKYLGPADERHSCEIHRAYHREHHYADGAELVTGGTVADYVVNESAPAGDDDNTFSVVETVFFDEDRTVTCAALTDPTGAGGDCMTMTRTGAATYGWAWSDVPFVFTPAGYINWNNGGTAIEGQSGKFYCTYLFATNFAGDGRFVNLLGRGEYATFSEAEGENIGLFDLAGFPSAESVVLYRFVWATDSTYTTKGKVRMATEPVAIMESFVALQNRALSRPVRTLDDLKDVTIATPTVDQVLKYNGTQWVNGEAATLGAGPGLEFYFDNTNVIAASAENAFALDTIVTSPTADVEGTETVTVNNQTLVSKAYVTASALGRTTIDGGVFNYVTWAGTSSTAGTNTLQVSFHRVIPNAVYTVTITGAGTSRTCTISGGSHFVSGDANASPALCGYVQTPKGLYPITAYGSATSVTVETPVGYVNESTVAWSQWRYIGNIATTDINTTTPTYTAFDELSVFAATACAVTDKLGVVVTGTTTRTSATTITWTREGSTRYSHVGTPMGVTHEQLQQLLGGAANDHYHVTGAQATTLGGLTTAVQGDLVFGSAANTWSRLAKSTTANQFVKNSGSSNNPTWASVNTTDLATAVTGVLKGNGTGVEVATAGTDYAGIGSANTFTGVNKFENAAGVEIGKDAATNTAGLLKLWSAGANNYYTTFTAGTQSANATYTWPTAMPAVTGYVLSCTDAGAMSWAAVAAAGANTALSNLASVAINTTLLPGSNDGAGLGNGTFSFSDLFLASGGVINWANGDVTLTHAADTLSLMGGMIVIGGLTAGTVVSGTTYSCPLKVSHDFSNPTSMGGMYLETAGGAPAVRCVRSNGTRAARTIVAEGDAVGAITGYGYDGTEYKPCATINLLVGGTPGVGDMPGAITFMTTPDGSSSMGERLRITSAGLIGIASASPSALLTLGTAGTTAGTLSLAGSTSGVVTVQTAAAAGTWSLTLPTTGGTNGYFLQTNGSGVATWAASTASPGGSSGYVQFNDGSSGFGGDSGLFWDNTAKRLGIGNVNPNWQQELSSDTASTLAVSTFAAAGIPTLVLNRGRGTRAASTPVMASDGLGTIYFTGVYQSATPAGYAGAYMGALATENWSTTATGSAIAFTTTANATVTHVERLRINHNGYIGIGCSDPSQLLELSANASVTTLLSTFSDSGAPIVKLNRGRGTRAASTPVVANDILGYFSFGGVYQNATPVGYASAYISGIATENWEPTATGSRIVFYTTANTTTTQLERLRISSTGNVFISTTDEDGTPAVGRLVVKGSTNDGTTNIFVGRDSDEANVASLDSNGVWTAAGLALGAGNITMTGSLGVTGSRLTKGWFTDLEVTNAIAGSITGNAATVTAANEVSDTECYLGYVTGATGAQGLKTTTNLVLNSATRCLTVTASTADGSTNILDLKDSGSASVHTIDTDGRMTKVKTMGYSGVFDIGNSSTAFTVTLSNGQHQKVTMTGNAAMTIVDTGNIGDGNWSIEVIQNGTGGWSITSGTVSGGTVRTAGGTDPALSAGANDVDTISIQKRGTVYTVSVVEKDLVTWT